MSKFNIGDKVYCPKFGTEIYTVYKDEYFRTSLTVRTGNGSFLGIDEDGKHNKHDILPSVFHATDENKILLEKLYGVSFADRKRILKGSALCKHLLRTRTHVICKVSNTNDSHACDEHFPRIDCIFRYCHSSGLFIGSGGVSHAWRYAVPISAETLQPLEMEIENE